MNSFLEAMSWVEEKHSFPEDMANFHERRFVELAESSRLFDGLPTLVVVAGSCGKASTARFLACMLQLAGLRVGLGTKPPLSESADGHRERYQLFDQEGEHWIEPDLFAQIVDPLPAFVETLSRESGAPAPYDLRTWILLNAFKAWNVDVGIVEANIGLRHDPAGSLPAALTIITPIATDHAQMLQAPAEWSHLGVPAGPLWHKLSACPSGRVVVSRQSNISETDLDELMNRPGPRLGRDFHLDEVSSGLWGNRGRLRFGQRELILELGCLGEFQLENAATAAMAYFELRGEDVDVAPVLEGAKLNQIPGRLQVIGREPLELLCVASSQPKVEAMLDSLETLFESEDSRMVLVLTLLDRVHGKEDVVSYIASHPRLETLITTEGTYPDDSKDISPDLLADLARAAAPDLEILACSDPDEAVVLARTKVGKNGLLILLGNGIASTISSNQ